MMPPVNNQICVRICARDAMGRDATRETRRFGIDAPCPLIAISAATRDYARLLRRTSYGSEPRGRGFKSLPATKARGPFSNRERAFCMWFVNWFVNLRFVHPASRAVPVISNEVSDPPMINSARVLATQGLGIVA